METVACDRSPSPKWLRKVALAPRCSDAIRLLTLLTELPPDRPDAAPPSQDDVSDLIMFLEAELPKIRDNCATALQPAVLATLTDDDYLYIMAYTAAEPYPLYNLVNAWVMCDRRSPTVAPIVGPFVKGLILALMKLDPVVAPGFRAVRVRSIPGLVRAFEQYETVLARGKPVNFWSFASFTSDPRILSDPTFSGGPNERAILYQCEKLVGVDIGAFSVAPRDEKEMLVIPPAMFQVVVCMQVPNTQKIVCTVRMIDNSAYEYAGVSSIERQKFTALVRPSASQSLGIRTDAIFIVDASNDPKNKSFVCSIGNCRGSGPNQFDYPHGVATLANGHVIAVDSYNHRLQVVNPLDGSFVRSIGKGRGCGSNQFFYPYGVSTLPNGHVVVSDASNHRLQVVNPVDGSFIRSIGNGEGSGSNQFFYPYGVTALPNGHVVVADTYNHRLQVVKTIDGSFVASIGDGQGSGPNQFTSPCGVTALPNGLVVVCDASNHRLQVVDPIDGSFIRSIGNGEGSGLNQFTAPSGVAALPNGLVLVCDTRNHRLQVVNPIDGSFVRSIGNGQGSGRNQFNSPSAVTTLPNGLVVVVDRCNSRLQLVNPVDDQLLCDRSATNDTIGRSASTLRTE
jgi:hypothetical protein